MKRRLLVVLCLLALLTGCGLITQPAPTPSPTLIPTPKPPPYAEYLGYFQQELLFIQQGLRQHDIDQTFTVYFAAPDFGKQRIALDDGEGVWEESFSFVYDKELRWFTFSELYEPVLTQNTTYRTDRDDWAEFFNTAIYKTELSDDTELAVPIRFDIPNGPQENDILYATVRDDGKPCYHIFHYKYIDSRLDTAVSIFYPQLVYGAPIAVLRYINGKIETVLFDAHTDGEYSRKTVPYLGSFPVKDCEVTRNDALCFSTRTYSYDPNAIDTPLYYFFAMTFDMESAQLLTLRDIIGAKTLDELLATGAFQCQYAYGPGPDGRLHHPPEQTEIEQIKAGFDPDSTEGFYLTADTLVLIGGGGALCFFMEAPLSALGLSQWIQTDS